MSWEEDQFELAVFARAIPRCQIANTRRILLVGRKENDVIILISAFFSCSDSHSTAYSFFCWIWSFYFKFDVGSLLYVVSVQTETIHNAATDVLVQPFIFLESTCWMLNPSQPLPFTRYVASPFDSMIWFPRYCFATLQSRIALHSVICKAMQFKADCLKWSWAESTGVIKLSLHPVIQILAS